MKRLLRWIFKGEIERLEELIKLNSQAFTILNTKLDAIHESMQKELARFDNDLQNIADLSTKTEDKLNDLKTFLTPAERKIYDEMQNKQQE